MNTENIDDNIQDTQSLSSITEPVIADVTLAKRYIDVVRSWGYIGEITNLVIVDSMLIFLHNGCQSMCPAECDKIHSVRVKVVNRIEELVSIM